MSGIKGHPNQKRFAHGGSAERFVSVLATDPKNRSGLDVLPKAMYPVDVLVKTAETLDLDTPLPDSELKIIKLTGASTTVRKGDIVRFDTGDNKGMEIPVEKVETDYIYLAGELLEDPDGEDFFHMRFITLTIDESGALSVSSGALSFVKDSVTQQVIKDTVTAANTVGLPVEIVGTNGAEINITAGDINVQTQHDGANPDSMRIGDGTNLMGVNASLEALVHDADALTQLTAIAGEDFATQATLEAARVLLASLDGKDFATQTTLAALLTELQAKADLSETQPVSAAALPLPSGAATETTLASLEAKDFATQTTLAAVLAKMIAAPATEAKQNDIIAALGSSLDVVDSVDGNMIDPSSTAIPASAAGYLEIVASLAADVKEIQVIEDIGEFIGLYAGAAASEVFVCVLPPGFTGSKLPVQLAAGTRLSVRNMKNAAISTNTRLAINFLG